MKCTLLGFKSLNFLDNEGKQIKGVKIYIAYPDNDVYGTAAEGKFIQQPQFDMFGVTLQQLEENIDCIIDVEFGRKDKIVGIDIMSAPEPATTKNEKKAG